MSSPPNKQAGYLSGLASYSPWGSRSNTPRFGPQDSSKKPDEPSFEAQRGGDHSVSRRHRLSLRQYPRDCPPLNVKWFHATDIPKRKPQIKVDVKAGEAEKAQPLPKKYVPFSDRDSRAVEMAFQKLALEGDAAARHRLSKRAGGPMEADHEEESGDLGISAQDSRDTKLRRTEAEWDDSVKVPVNEDFLFDVDVERRELAPAYWLGPVYDCRRGTWFTSDGTNLKPLDENLATQLEEGYLKVKPWRFPKQAQPQHQRSASMSSKTRSRPSSFALDSKTASLTPKSSAESLKSKSKDNSADITSSSEVVQRTFRLFGAHMNSVVTYQDDMTAWIVTEDFLSGMKGTMYERFAGGAHYAGLKVVRGFTETAKKEAKDGKASAETSPKLDTADRSLEKQDTESKEEEEPQSPSLTRRITLERQMSSLVESGAFNSRENQEEEIRKRDEKEIENDYNDDGEEQGRDIEHLILVTHGIGQQLGLRFESVNFVHDVNTLRKTLKSVYAGSPDLQALNAEVEKLSKNCRVQVLPICWRHLLDFPKQGLKHSRKEHDLSEAHDEEDDVYPGIDDITVNNMFRSLITDLALDIMLYQSPAYKPHITRIVLDECNRIYRLFKQRKPTFNGKVSLMGHSLGSAVMFDILCNQKVDPTTPAASTKRFSYGGRDKDHPHRKSTNDSLQLEFPVEDFYALGSPVGLFQMIKGRTIAARATPNIKPAQTPFVTVDDPFGAPSTANSYLDSRTSSPKCQRLYNIFHPTDPISYRLEPLISPAMAQLKPQPLPYTKKGIFGAAGQGVSGIGAKVGQTFGGLWTSLSSGIASSLLNRSLGISADDAARVQQSRAPLGANDQIGPIAPSDAEKLIKGDLTVQDGVDGQHPPTQLDDEIETLYSGFKKTHKASGAGPLEKDEERRELEEQARKLKKEERKVRALNSNGRVDYSIQE
jgi:hypothetical protein